MPPKLTAEIINAAIEGFESQKRRIDSQIDDLRQLLKGDRNQSPAVDKAPTHRRKMSAAGRRRIAAAQKARWAKIRGEAEPSPSSATAAAPRRKRKLSAAGRKAISEATKRRWALKRAEGQKSQSTVAKKSANTAGKKPRKQAKKTPAAAETAAA
jgi:hypothetical protein